MTSRTIAETTRTATGVPFFAENSNVQQIKSRDELDVLTDGVSVSTYDLKLQVYRFNTLSPNTQSSTVDYSTLVSMSTFMGLLDKDTQRSGFRYYFDQMSKKSENRRRRSGCT